MRYRGLPLWSYSMYFSENEKSVGYDRIDSNFYSKTFNAVKL